MTRWVVRGLVLAAVAVVAGCGGDGEPETAPPVAITPSPSAAASAGPVYALAGNLCGVADQKPLDELFPTVTGKPIADSPRLCATSRRSSTVSVSLSIDAELLRTEQQAKLFLDAARRTNKVGTPTDVQGVGTDAYWAGDPKEVNLTAYDGNLVLELRIASVGDNPLPQGVPERLARVAEGTFAKLAP
ncbi:hypothetical protein [Phytohabitans kaempferiae]|uniref:DUF3558 domain-containing protein n=1 Tax=Phytohabitans kaempferiae TaxID=1620943 RepID=A0ABV6M8T2_9ACTN